MIKGMNFYSVAPNLKVVKKSVVQGKKPDSQGKLPVYYNLMLECEDPSNPGHTEIGVVGCEFDVYNRVIEGKSYDFGYKINTAYDKIFVRFSEFFETNSTKK